MLRSGLTTGCFQVGDKQRLCPRNWYNCNISIGGKSDVGGSFWGFLWIETKVVFFFWTHRGHKAQLESDWVKIYSRQNHFLAVWHLLHADHCVCTARSQWVLLSGTECVGSRHRWYQLCQCAFDCFGERRGERGGVGGTCQDLNLSRPLLNLQRLIITWMLERSSNAQGWYFPDNLTFCEWALRMRYHSNLKYWMWRRTRRTHKIEVWEWRKRGDSGALLLGLEESASFRLSEFWLNARKLYNGCVHHFRSKVNTSTRIRQRDF